MGLPNKGLARLEALWRHATSPAYHLTVWAWGAGWLALAVLVGREGLPWSRAAAGFAFIVGLLPLLALLRRQWRRPDAADIVRTTLLATQPKLARAALRALELSRQAREQPASGSPELAELHFARVLSRAALPPLQTRAGRIATAATVLAASLATVTLVVVAQDPFRIIEGIDVLAANDGRAPLAIEWVSPPRLQAQSPSYLQQPPRPLRPYFPAAVPNGTVITVQAKAHYGDRELVLSDGVSEVPFTEVDDQQLMARWTVREDTSLHIAARFGDILILEPEKLDIHAIADAPPHVVLETAPATLSLLTHPRVPVHWHAVDDHGLREVALVLRAGDEEVRRPLSQLQGRALSDRGGIELQANDPFLRANYLPIELTVQALDNDRIGGPKWGSSQAIMLLPPQIGEREALRFAALRAARDSITDLLAHRMAAPDVPAPPSAVAPPSLKSTIESLKASLSANFGGLRLSGALAALVGGQLERLALSSDGDAVPQIERALLAIDAALQALGARDTRASAKRLSDVATEAARAIADSREPNLRERAEQRLSANLVVLEKGAANLLRLGQLGLDLGELTQNGIRRIRRARSAGDAPHAELAARDLAARLRQPDPSFGSAGGSQGHGGGVESGGQQQAQQAEASQAAKDAEGAASALEQLRLDHAAQIADVMKALTESEGKTSDPSQRRARQERHREIAQELRKRFGVEPGKSNAPSTSSGSSGPPQSRAAAMAAALDRGRVNEALREGQESLSRLGEESQQGLPGVPQARGPSAKEQRQYLQEIIDELKESQRTLEEKVPEDLRNRLKQLAKREKELARRAREIRERNQASEAPLPQKLLRRLQQAAKKMASAGEELARGKGSEGLRQQRAAQQLLEQAQPETDESDDQPHSSGENGKFARDAKVPGGSSDERARAFRERVARGLRHQSPPRLRDAIRRYTEGLLR